MKIFFVLPILFLLFVTTIACGRSNKSEKRQEQIQLLTHLQNNSTPTSSLESACFNFLSVENTCIVLGDSQTSTCSSTEITRLKKGIQPIEQGTDSILEAFLGCWKNCALLFNATNSICTGAKYPTTMTYREAQKSTSTTASAVWGACMTKCNNGESEENGLKGTGATYPTQPF